MADDERSNQVAGVVYFGCTAVGWLSLVCSIGCSVAAMSDRSLAGAAAVFMLASAVAFGLLANAVLRR
jgi:hypothetical protein